MQRTVLNSDVLDRRRIPFCCVPPRAWAAQHSTARAAPCASRKLPYINHQSIVSYNSKLHRSQNPTVAQLDHTLQPQTKVPPPPPFFSFPSSQVPFIHVSTVSLQRLLLLVRCDPNPCFVCSVTIKLDLQASPALYRLHRDTAYIMFRVHGAVPFGTTLHHFSELNLRDCLACLGAVQSSMDCSVSCSSSCCC